MKTKQFTFRSFFYMLLISLVLTSFMSCSKETPEPDPDPINQPDPDKNPDENDENSNQDAINSLIANLTYNPEDLLNVQNTGGAPSERTKTNENNFTTGPNKGIMVTCNKADYDLASNFDDVAILRPTNGVVYPGALVIGNAGMLDGAPDPLALGRAPMTLRLDLPGIGEQGNIVVEEPNNSNVQSGLDEALEWWNGNAYEEGYVNAANSTYQATTSYSSKQMSLDVGLNVEWANGSVASQFEYESSSTKRVASLVYKQVFYTVTMDTPLSPAEVFGSEVTEAQAAAVISSENPPAYVNSVSYGRIIMFRMETTNTDTTIDIDASLEYATGAVEGSGTVDSKFEEVLKNSSITIVTIGGNAEVATEAVDVASIDNWKGALNGVIKGSNAVYSRDNPGVPIAYSIRYLKDNTLAKMGYTTEYSVEECEEFNYDHENVEVENNSNYDIRYRFIYKKPGTNNSTSTGFTEVSQNKRSIKSPPNGAHDVEIQFDFQDLFVWTRMGEFNLGYLSSDKCYEADSAFFQVTVEGVSCN